MDIIFFLHFEDKTIANKFGNVMQEKGGNEEGLRSRNAGVVIY